MAPAVALDIFLRPITAFESRQQFPSKNLHSTAMSIRGPNSYDDGYIHILGHEERTYPKHGD
jgi:hypothetical protein